MNRRKFFSALAGLAPALVLAKNVQQSPPPITIGTVGNLGNQPIQTFDFKFHVPKDASGKPYAKFLGPHSDPKGLPGPPAPAFGIPGPNDSALTKSYRL